MTENFLQISQAIDPKFCTKFCEWFRCTSNIYTDLLEKFDDQPFHENEMAGVSLILSGAVRANLPAIMEWPVDKSGKPHGRSDLWVHVEETDCWFEFKRAAWNPNASKWGLSYSLDAAIYSAKEMTFLSGEMGFAGVIAATDNLVDTRREIYMNFCKEVDFAYRIGPDDNRGVYIYLKVVEQN